MTTQVIEAPDVRDAALEDLITPFRLNPQHNKTITFGRPYMATSALIQATAEEWEASDVRFQFFDSLGSKVGEGVLQPSERKTSTAEVVFGKPLQLASTNIASYWNGAAIRFLRVSPLPAQTTRSFVSEQQIGEGGLVIPLERPLRVIGAICSARGITQNHSDVHFYLDETAGGKQVADLVMQPTNAAESTLVYTFNEVKVGALRLFSWWNSAWANRLELIYLP